ncbi:MAG: preprotein translocase subunit SecG [Prevotella sp.]|nr:preprotein translocase subunit SecG [Candidatus Equicola faecalis]
MYTLLIVIFVILAVAMILIVLVQESKGGGLASGFAASNQVLGVRKTTDFIEKMTWGLAAGLVIFSIACAWISPQKSSNASVIENAATQEAPLGSKTLPGFDASATQENAKPKIGNNAGKQTDEAAKETPAEAPAAPQAK